MTRVPTTAGPVGAGTAAEVVFAKSDSTSVPLRILRNVVALPERAIC
jgi:hypothetical protein